MTDIHHTAVVAESAVIGENCVIGPYCVVGPSVVLGEGCRLHSHVVMEGATTVGCGNVFLSFASIGHVPPDIKFRGEKTWLEIGDYNVFREGVTVHVGTADGGGVTRIGHHNMCLPYVHIAHDCQIGDHNIFVNNTSLAGHVTCGSYVNLAGFTLVTQYCQIGDYVHSSIACRITKHVPSYLRLAASPVRAVGLNQVGMQRSGHFSDEVIAVLKKVYKMVYSKKVLLKEALAELKVSPWFDQYQEVRHFARGLEVDSRGIIR